MLGFLRPTFAVFGLSLVVACSDPPGGGGDSCGDAGTGPTFVLTVRAVEGNLPHDLTLEAQYGGGSEGFDLAHPTAKHEVLYCEVERALPAGLGGEGGAPSPGLGHGGGLGGGGSAGAKQIVCELWTDSAVTVTLTGTGYETSQVELEPEVDERCGVETKSVEAVLAPELPAEGP
jgi:hypothetical protein